VSEGSIEVKTAVMGRQENGNAKNASQGSFLRLYRSPVEAARTVCIIVENQRDR
jgi:hypothetical protein